MLFAMSVEDKLRDLRSRVDHLSPPSGDPQDQPAPGSLRQLLNAAQGAATRLDKHKLHNRGGSHAPLERELERLVAQLEVAVRECEGRSEEE